MKHPYSYVILRYVHDIMTGERLNVGVVVYSAKAQYLGALCRPTYLRLSHAFPGMRGDSFRSVSRYIQDELQRIGEGLQRGLQASEIQRDITALVTSVLPKDESAFQWSEPAIGVSGDLPRTLDDLYERLVTKYDERGPLKNKSDEDVWRGYKKDLEQRRVLKYLKPKRIVTADDEIDFQHAWKNGAWHCLEPVSFDLARADSIREKAHKLIGELSSVQSSTQEKFKVYFLIGKPQSSSVMEAYEKALRIIDKAPGIKEIVTEENSEQFIEQFAKEIEQHEGTLHRG
jgi:transcription initiation factor IIE alpha subunit